MIEAKILCDSESPSGVRLTTMMLTYPRFIHSELMTHRVFSRNAASSRAIPFDRMWKTIKDNPARPVKWGTHQKGMQSGAPLGAADQIMAQKEWDMAMINAIDSARALDSMGVHKSITNRLLEPFAHMTTVVTATEWHNFFALRAHPDAQPEFQELAYQMLDAYLGGFPIPFKYGMWHTPFMNEETRQACTTVEEVCRVSVARCARVSYANFKETSITDDLELTDRLQVSGHWSPFEHVATPNRHHWSGNFRGWQQYRKCFYNENRTDFNLRELKRP